MKQIKWVRHYSSIFGQPKWLIGINISNFSCEKPKANRKFLIKLNKLINNYNKAKK